MVKYLECPNCSFVFKAPAMDLKFAGLGWTVPGLGVVKCPQCKESKRRKYYKVVQESDLARNAVVKEDETVMAKPTAEKDLIEDSKYEDE